MRSVVAVLAGYFVSALAAILVFPFIAIVAPEALHEEEARVDQPWLAIVVVVGFFGAVLGGWVCATVANLLGRQSPFAHVIALGMLSLALWMAFMVAAPPQQSTAYQVSLNLTCVAGLLIGGAVWSWRARGARGSAAR